MILKIIKASYELSRHITKRGYSTNFFLTEINKNGIAIMSMNRRPVNALNYEFLVEMKDALHNLEKEKIKGVILTSALKNVYSAGLDFTQIYKPEKDKFLAFWTALQDVWVKMISFSHPTVALINGHAPAGGCVFALFCNYRIMLPNFTIGLNETQVGIVPPRILVATMRRTMSIRDSELALTTGKLFSTDEAFKVHLIDEIANDGEDALKRSYKFFERYDNVNVEARRLTSKSLKQTIIQDLLAKRESNSQNIFNYLNNPEVVNKMKNYIDSLKRK